MIYYQRQGPAERRYLLSLQSITSSTGGFSRLPPINVGDEETLKCERAARRNTARPNQTCVAHKRRACFVSGACTSNLTSWLLTFTFALQRKQKGSTPQRGAACRSQNLLLRRASASPKFDCVCIAVETCLQSRKLMPDICLTHGWEAGRRVPRKDGSVSPRDPHRSSGDGAQGSLLRDAGPKEERSSSSSPAVPPRHYPPPPPPPALAARLPVPRRLASPPPAALHPPLIGKGAGFFQIEKRKILAVI